MSLVPPLPPLAKIEPIKSSDPAEKMAKAPPPEPPPPPAPRPPSCPAIPFRRKVPAMLAELLASNVSGLLPSTLTIAEEARLIEVKSKTGIYTSGCSIPPELAGNNTALRLDISF